MFSSVLVFVASPLYTPLIGEKNMHLLASARNFTLPFRLNGGRDLSGLSRAFASTTGLESFAEAALFPK